MPPLLVRPARPSRQGFTLIELLVVMDAVTLPTFLMVSRLDEVRAAMTAATASACASNDIKG